DDSRDAGLEDASLVDGDLAHRIAEKFRMIEGDRRKRADRRPIDHVGGVAATAESDLEQNEVGGDARKGQESGGGGDLEEGDGPPGIDALDLFKERRKKIVLDEGPGEPDALVEADEMR